MNRTRNRTRTWWRIVRVKWCRSIHTSPGNLMYAGGRVYECRRCGIRFESVLDPKAAAVDRKSGVDAGGSGWHPERITVSVSGQITAEL